MAKTRAQTSGKPRRPAPPLTAHRLFPPLVALWFSALFSLGSLAVRPVVLEAAMLALRIDRVLPFAAPPLGMKARVLLALVMAAFGAVAGVVLARRLGRERLPTPEQPTGPAGTADAPVLRRRRLSVEQPERDYSLTSAPLPGGAPPILDVRECEFVDHPAPSQPATAMLDLAALTVEPAGRSAPEPVAPATPARLFASAPAPDSRCAEQAEPAAAAAVPESTRQEFVRPPASPAPAFNPAEAVASAVPAPVVAASTAPPPPPPAPAAVAVPVAPLPDPATASHLELVNRLALSMQARRSGFGGGNVARFAQRPVEPARATPCPAGVDRAETEQALRSALVTLQRLSGAA